MKNGIVFCITLLWINFSFAQITTGYIRDEENLEPLIGALISIEGSIFGTVTNEFGYFSLTSSQKRNKRLIISYLGYASDTIAINDDVQPTLNIFLTPNAKLPTVEVQATHSTNNYDLDINPLSVAELKAVPAILGETDIVRALSFTPGVSTGAEGTTGLFVRGGTPDQNLVLLDGATVYNASHLFGFLSVFNADAVKKVRLIKAGFPPEYGGRLSSVLDINMKEGNKKQVKKSFSVGILSSRLLVEGPIKKEKSSFMLAARTSYLSLLTVPVKIMFNNGKRNYHSGYWLYDLNGKVNFEINEKEQIYASFYGGQDFYENLARLEGKEYQRSLHWGNQTGNLRYIRQLKGGVFTKLQLNYNRYQYKKSDRINDEDDDEFEVDDVAIVNSSGIEDISLKNSWNWLMGERQYWKAGVEVTRHRFTPGLLETEFGADTLRSIQLNIQPWEIATYVNHQMQWSDKWQSNLGFRYAWYRTEGLNYQFLEPRLSLQFSPNAQQNWSYFFTKMSQPIHLLTSNNVGLPNDIWYPATSDLPPQFSYQNSLTFRQFIPAWQTSFTLAAYYKTLKQQVDYREGTNLATANEDWQNLLEQNGQGEAYGGEVFIHKETGRWKGWLSYTLSWNNRQFNNLNGGRWYPHRFDRRHDLAIVANYELTKKWQIAANFVYSTGNAVTLPNTFLQNDLGVAIPIYTARNNARMPDFHRLDLSFTRTKLNKKGKETQLNFSIYNAYARKNPNILLSRRRSPGSPFEPGGRLKDQVTISYAYRSLFSVIPSVSYQIKL